MLGPQSKRGKNIAKKLNEKKTKDRTKEQPSLIGQIADTINRIADLDNPVLLFDLI